MMRLVIKILPVMRIWRSPFQKELPAIVSALLHSLLPTIESMALSWFQSGATWKRFTSLRATSMPVILLAKGGTPNMLKLRHIFVAYCEVWAKFAA
jgi:hypothetical protein